MLSEIKDMVTPGTTISWSEMLMQREQVGLSRLGGEGLEEKNENSFPFDFPVVYSSHEL